MRKLIGLSIICGAIIFVSLGFHYKTSSTGEEHVVKITAKKFEFSPGEIKVKKGETVVLELSSSDRIHGFSLPDFKVRSEVKPGEVTRVKFTADRVGQFTFSCNVFCGDGHEDMNGTLIVSE